MKKILFIDCDSTLSSIEGIDELARLRGPEVFEKVRQMTARAMDEGIPLEQVFQQRLELIQPTFTEVTALAEVYWTHRAKGVEGVVQRLQSEGWECIVVSGGFTPAITPFAKKLQLKEVHAVPLHFSSEGKYSSFGPSALARSRGKIEVIREIKGKYSSALTVHVGDGGTDAEAKEVVDLFIAYTEFAARPAVLAQAEKQAATFEEVEELLKHLDRK